jgi:hypothetical protein
MNIIDRAFSGFRKGAANVKRFGTMNNANKYLSGANLGLKSLGGYALKGKDIYNRALGANLIPETSVGNNVVKVLDTLGKLN